MARYGSDDAGVAQMSQRWDLGAAPPVRGAFWGSSGSWFTFAEGEVGRGIGSQRNGCLIASLFSNGAGLLVWYECLLVAATPCNNLEHACRNTEKKADWAVITLGIITNCAYFLGISILATNE
jgi:hypothetical protein